MIKLFAQTFAVFALAQLVSGSVNAAAEPTRMVPLTIRCWISVVNYSGEKNFSDSDSSTFKGGRLHTFSKESAPVKLASQGRFEFWVRSDSMIVAKEKGIKELSTYGVEIRDKKTGMIASSLSDDRATPAKPEYAFKIADVKFVEYTKPAEPDVETGSVGLHCLHRQSDEKERLQLSH